MVSYARLPRPSRLCSGIQFWQLIMCHHYKCRNPFLIKVPCRGSLTHDHDFSNRCFGNMIGLWSFAASWFLLTENEDSDQIRLNRVWLKVGRLEKHQADCRLVPIEGLQQWVWNLWNLKLRKIRLRLELAGRIIYWISCLWFLFFKWGTSIAKVSWHGVPIWRLDRLCLGVFRRRR